MPTDPSIILGVNQDPGIQPGQLVSLFDVAQQVKQYQQKQAGQNALKAVFSDPNSVDPKTGLPNNDAIRKVMQVDPDMGIKLRETSLDAQAKNLQMEAYKTEQGKTRHDFMSQVAGAGVDAYNEAKAAGKPEVDAVAAGQSARNTAAKNSGGIVGDDVVDGITGAPFDPMGAKALASTNKDWVSAADKRQTLVRQDKQETERERHDEAMEANTLHGQNIKVETGENNKWQVLTDPKSQTQYRYNPETGAATTLDGKTPYSPGGAAKLAGGSAPRSAASAYIQKYMQDNPTATSDDISKAASRFRLGQSEAGTIGTRAGAADVAGKDVEIFAKQARDASKALPRSDYAIANEVLQNWDMKTKNPELRQLMIAADALVNSRARAISPTGSPHVNDQLEGRKMLSSAFASGDFEAAVQQMEKEAAGVKEATRQTKAEFDGDGANKGGGPVKITDAAGYNALASGTHFIDPKGIERVKP